MCSKIKILVIYRTTSLSEKKNSIDRYQKIWAWRQVKNKKIKILLTVIKFWRGAKTLFT